STVMLPVAPAGGTCPATPPAQPGSHASNVQAVARARLPERKTRDARALLTGCFEILNGCPYSLGDPKRDADRSRLPMSNLQVCWGRVKEGGVAQSFSNSWR